MSFDGYRFYAVGINGMIAALTQEVNVVLARYRMNSRRLTDISDLNRHLLKQGVAQRYFFVLLAVGQNHFVQGIPQHCTAIFQFLPFGDDLGHSINWPR